MTSSAASPPTPRGRVQLLLLATLFFFPLAISYGLYFWFPEFRPTGRTNYGELIDPARPLPELKFVDEAGAALDQTTFRGRWTYFVSAGADCDVTCAEHLILLRQLRLITNEKRSRIQRVLILDDPKNLAAVHARLKPEHPDLRVLADVGATGARLDDFLQPPGAMAYLVDPLGNWLLVYRAGADTQTDFKGMRKDIQKLLRLSRIG